MMKVKITALPLQLPPPPPAFTNMIPTQIAWRKEGIVPSAQNMPSDCMFGGIVRVSEATGSDLYDCLRKAIQRDRLIVHYGELEHHLVVSSERFHKESADRPAAFLRTSFARPLTSTTKQRVLFLTSYTKASFDETDGRTEFVFTCDVATIDKRLLPEI
jgi:hypothetical protein